MRIGGNRRGRRYLYTHAINPPAGKSASDHHMAYGAVFDLPPTAGRPRLSVADAERTVAREQLAAAGIDFSRPVIGLHPGGKWSVKRWPADSYASMVSLLKRDTDVDVVVFTGPAEVEHTRHLYDTLGDQAVYMDPVSIREMLALLAEMQVVVLSDGGVMHMSVAAGTPTVGIFGSAQPELWFPYEAFGPYRAAYIDMDCRPCHAHVCPLVHTDCLAKLPPAAVAEMITGLLPAGGGEAQ